MKSKNNSSDSENNNFLEQESDSNSNQNPNQKHDSKQKEDEKKLPELENKSSLDQGLIDKIIEKQQQDKQTASKKARNNLIFAVLILVSMLSLAFLYGGSGNSEMGSNNGGGSLAQTSILGGAPKKTFSDLLTQIREGKVSEMTLTLDGSTLRVKKYLPLSDELKKEGENLKNSNPAEYEKNKSKYAEKSRDRVEIVNYEMVDKDKQVSALQVIKNGIGDDKVKFGTGEGEIIFSEERPNIIMQVLRSDLFWTIVLVVIALGTAAFMLKRAGDANSKAISFGNSKGKMYNIEKNTKITFADVAGNEEAKQELVEIVDFLKRPKEYQKMGAKIPKGVLLSGAPGNGKTLLAKAIAGEAKVPFFYLSGSEFVEMFVGVGASRVRHLFEEAKKKSPCIIFIDEIDAVGRQRGAGLGGGNDEKEQTLNQVLVSMDGFEENEHVIVIGATNRPDVLDPALLRPGRFDRQVTVTTPDRKERKAILDIHSKNKKLAEGIDMDIIAKRTSGFSGADLMNVLNEAAILAVRESKPAIDDECVREAIEKVILGPSLKSKLITPEQKELTAYHEAGHALVQTVMPDGKKVQKITIIPRGRAGGYTFADSDDNFTTKRAQFLADITTLFGGYCAEELIYGDVSTGASNDLQRATEIARGMVTKYGMSGLGPISFDEGKGLSFLGKDMMEQKHFSEESAKEIDKEIRKILESCYKECQKLLRKYESKLHEIAKTLMDKEVVEYEEYAELVKDIIPKAKLKRA